MNAAAQVMVGGFEASNVDLQEPPQSQGRE